MCGEFFRYCLLRPDAQYVALDGGITYRYFGGEVQYPFGYGLSYTTFSYSDVVLNNTAPLGCDYIGVSVTVYNTGKVDGDEVVQVKRCCAPTSVHTR